MKICKQIAIFLSLSSSLAKAGEFFEYGQSLRALGMGNAYIAVVDDGDSLFYNPAGLGRAKGINLRVLNLNLGINGQETYDTVQAMSASSATGVERFSEFFGSSLWVGLGGKATLTIPNFGFGVYSSGFADIELRDPILPYFDIHYLNDYGFALGGALEIGPKAHGGITLKRINRTGTNQEFGISTFLDGQTSSIQSNLDRKGVGYGVDLGFTWELPLPFSPVIAGVWNDVGTTSFLPEGDSDPPPNLYDEQILGISTSFDTLLFGMTTAIDIKHFNQYSESLGKKIHLGIELNLPIIDIRAGFSQGYYSLGTSLDLFIAQLELAYYGVERGEYAGQDEDRRIQLALTMDFEFDPQFNLLSVGKGQRRQLKRRR